MIWKNLEYNIGYAFDISTGVFTCPHDGIYSFYATSLVYGQKTGGINIYVNGSDNRVFHHLSIMGGYSQNSPSGVFKLNQGDTVHIRMSGTFFFPNSDCRRIYFQGHLIDLL